MLDNLLTVGTQVLILFAMISMGFVLSKTKMVTEAGVSGMTNTLLWAVTPCLVIEVFCRSFEKDLAVALGNFRGHLFHCLAHILSPLPEFLKPAPGPFVNGCGHIKLMLTFGNNIGAYLTTIHYHIRCVGDITLVLSKLNTHRRYCADI